MKSYAYAPATNTSLQQQQQQPSALSLGPKTSSAGVPRASPSPPSSSPSSASFHYLPPPLPIPDDHASRTLHNHHHNHHSPHHHHLHTNNSPSPHRQQQQQQQQQPRHMYPTSSPFHRFDVSPDPSPPSHGNRLPPITSSFTNGYASPAASTHSSEPGSRDELDVVMGDLSAPSPGTNTHNNPNFHGQHVSLPGVDDMLSRGNNGMILDGTPSPRHEDRDWEGRRGWNMRDFTLIQTVGMLNFITPFASRSSSSMVLMSYCLLGTGTFGRVFLARFSTPRPNRPEFFALKVMSMRLNVLG